MHDFKVGDTEMNLDDVVDFSVGLGEVVAELGQDLSLGLERSIEGAGASGGGRQLQIGAENERAAKLLYEALTKAPGAANHPLTRIVTQIVIRYYDALPDEMVDALARKAGIVVGHAAAKVAVKSQVKAMLVKHVAPKIATKIAASAVYRSIATRLGVTAGATVSGVGTLLGLVLMQGLLQRGSVASQRLLSMAPDLHQIMRQDGLDMIYFLVEKPMQKQIQAIAAARTNAAVLKQAADRAIQKNQ